MFNLTLKTIHHKNHRKYIQKLLGGYISEKEKVKFEKISRKCKYCKMDISELIEISNKIEKREDIKISDDEFYKKAIDSLYFVENRSYLNKKLENFLMVPAHNEIKRAVRFAFFSLLLVIMLALPLYLNIYKSYKFSKNNRISLKKVTLNKNLNAQSKNDENELMDMIYITNYFSGNIEYLPKDKISHMDLNRDGKVNSVDLTLMLYKEIGEFGR